MAKNCSHAGLTALRKRRRGSRWVVQGQCAACREAVGDAVAREDHDFFPFWLPPRKKTPNTKRAREYKAYIRSPEWKTKRQDCLETAGFICQFPDCGDLATDADHDTYANFGAEKPGDLIALCNTHHRAIGEARVARAVLG